MNELSGARRLRILHSRMEVHSILWLVLLVGAVPTVAYPLLFSNKHAWVQVVIMGCIMLIVMLGLLVTLSLEHPFSGEFSIQPEAFRQLLDSFQDAVGKTRRTSSLSQRKWPRWCLCFNVFSDTHKSDDGHLLHGDICRLGLASTGGNYVSAGVLVLGVFLGSALWWIILSGGVGVFREKFNPRGLQWVNRISGAIITAFGLFALLTAL